MDLDLHVDVYERRDFTKPRPTGCNMCGGIVSESLVQMLAADGGTPTLVVVNSHQTSPARGAMLPCTVATQK